MRIPMLPSLLLLTGLAVSPAWAGDTGTGNQAAPAPAAANSQDMIQRSGPGFTVTAKVPVLAGAEPAIERVNREIRAFVDSFVEPFVADHEATTAEDDEQSEAMPWSLEIDHEPLYRTARYVAIAFNGYDFRGGAHGMPVIAPLVIDLASGAPVPPAGLFKPDADWLNVLAPYCLRELSGRDLMGDDDWLRTGAAPQAENYQLLYPGPDGLTVTFPPYAVAPYAAGPQEVLIPYDALKELLNPALFGH